MQTVEIEGKVRSEVGKKSTKAVRSAGQVPCVMYGGDGVVHFQTSSKSFKPVIYTPDFKLVEVKLDNGKSTRCILRDAQFHPVTDQLLHVDLLELVPGKTFNAELPVAYQGTSPGEKLGGRLIKKIRRVSVKMTPETMVDVLRLDIDELELGHSVRVKDLEEEEGVVVTNPPNAPVASVEIPRVLKDATAAELEEAEAEEGEAIEGEEAATAEGEAQKES